MMSLRARLSQSAGSIIRCRFRLTFEPLGKCLLIKDVASHYYFLTLALYIGGAKRFNPRPTTAIHALLRRSSMGAGADNKVLAWLWQASTTPRLRLPSFQLPNMPSWGQPTRSTLPHNVLISGPINACCPHHACHAQLRRGRNKRYQIGYGTHQVQSAKPSFRCLFPAPRGLPRLVVLEEKAGGALTGWKQRNRAHRGIQSRLRPGAASLVHGTNSVTIQPPIQGVTAESFNACQAAVLVLSHQSSPFPFLSATAYIEWILLSYRRRP